MKDDVSLPASNTNRCHCTQLLVYDEIRFIFIVIAQSHFVQKYNEIELLSHISPKEGLKEKQKKVK